MFQLILDNLAFSQNEFEIKEIKIKMGSLFKYLPKLVTCSCADDR